MLHKHEVFLFVILLYLFSNESGDLSSRHDFGQEPYSLGLGLPSVTLDWTTFLIFNNDMFRGNPVVFPMEFSGL